MAPFVFEGVLYLGEDFESLVINDVVLLRLSDINYNLWGLLTFHASESSTALTPRWPWLFYHYGL